MFSTLARSLDGNELTNRAKDMSGILKLAEALPHSQLMSLSLTQNKLRAEGCKAVAAVLDKTKITSLKCAPATLPSA